MGRASRTRPLRRPRGWLVAVVLVIQALPVPAQAQRVLVSGADTLAFDDVELRSLLDTTRALRRDLEEDPRILYYTGTGPAVPGREPRGAYPWNAVDVLADSVATIRTPGNLREADRAYANYAVLRMKNVRRDPDVECDSIFARELRAVSGFIDGWIVSRTLFGAPPYAALDSLVFARQAAVLPGLIADHANPQLGGCLAVWVRLHPDAIHAYRRWRGADAPPARSAERREQTGAAPL